MINWKVDIPEGKVDGWEVVRFIVTKKDEELELLRSAISFSSRGRYTPAGEYTALKHHGEIVMSDTPDEIRDFLMAIRMARGNCLINGLGLGIVLKAILEKEEVKHVTVIEKEPAVIKLVGTYFNEMFGERVEIIEADAFDYKLPKGTHYDMVWHDIWDNICADNLPEMQKLHRKYGRRCAWQGSWCRAECERSRGRC